MSWIVKSYKELILFAAVSAIYIVCTAPGATWAFLDCDLFDFMYSTKFMTISHFPGFPIYIMFGSLVQMFYAEGSAWGLALWGSTIPAIFTIIMIFYITRKLTDNKWSPYVAALGLAGASAYFSQTIIPEVYSFSIFMLVLTWFLLTYGKYSLGAIAAGLAAGTHIFVGPAILAMFFYYSGFRKKWYLFIPCAVLPYLYVVFGAVRSEWNASLPVGSGLEGFFKTYVWGTIYDNFKYWGAIAIWNFPKRLFETAVLLTTSFGLALIPMLYWFKDWKKAGFLIACIAVPVFYYVGCNVETAYVHFTLAFPFLAVAAGLGMDKFKLHPSIVLVASGILLLVFPLSFDIGNTLDKELSAQNMYRQIEQIPDGSVVFGYCEDTQGNATVGGREQVGIMYYDKLNNKHIVPLNTGWLINTDTVGDKSISEWSKETLEKFGLIVPELAVKKNMDEKLTREEWKSLILGNMQRLKDANPERKFYITKTISDETGSNYIFARKLVEW